MNRKDERGHVVAVLRGHVDRESAYVVHGHPDGFGVTCKMRHWIAPGTRGAAKETLRHVAQTSDERHGRPDRWRNPKTRSIAEWLWLVRFKNGDVDSVGLSRAWFSPRDWVTFYNTRIWARVAAEERGPIAAFALERWRRWSDEWELFAKRAAVLSRDLANPPSRGELTSATGGWLDREDYDALVAYVKAGGPVTIADWKAEQDGIRSPWGVPPEGGEEAERRRGNLARLRDELGAESADDDPGSHRYAAVAVRLDRTGTVVKAAIWCEDSTEAARELLGSSVLFGYAVGGLYDLDTGRKMEVEEEP